MLRGKLPNLKDKYYGAKPKPEVKADEPKKKVGGEARKVKKDKKNK